jgi:hypothetical protein
MDNTVYDDYIEFETAKLAKKLGYSNGSNLHAVLYKTTYVYDEDPNHHESYKEGEIRFKKQFWVKNGEEDNEYFEYFELPSQALLYKWLREKHNIQINISYGYHKDNTIFFKPSIMLILPNYRFDTIPIIFRNSDINWQDCFERCLIVSLKYLLNKIN